MERRSSCRESGQRMQALRTPSPRPLLPVLVVQLSCLVDPDSSARPQVRVPCPNPGSPFPAATTTTCPCGCYLFLSLTFCLIVCMSEAATMHVT